MQSKTRHWIGGLFIVLLSVSIYVLLVDTFSLLPEFLAVSGALLGVLLAVLHPRRGSVKRKMLVSRIILVLAGIGFLFSGIISALIPNLWTLSMVLGVFGAALLYAGLFKIPWATVTERLITYRTGKTTVIVPDKTRYWTYYVFAGVLFLSMSNLTYLLFPPGTPSEFVLTVSMFLFSILLMFGSPLSGSVERTLLVYKALFAVAGLGFLIDGTYSFVAEGSLLSGLFGLLGLFLLYHAFVRMSWEFVREVVEEYRSVEHPSTLGIERITERVQKRWDETEAS